MKRPTFKFPTVRTLGPSYLSLSFAVAALVALVPLAHACPDAKDKAERSSVEQQNVAKPTSTNLSPAESRELMRRRMAACKDRPETCVQSGETAGATDAPAIQHKLER